MLKFEFTGCNYDLPGKNQAAELPTSPPSNICVLHDIVLYLNAWVRDGYLKLGDYGNGFHSSD